MKKNRTKLGCLIITIGAGGLLYFAGPWITVSVLIIHFGYSYFFAGDDTHE